MTGATAERVLPHNARAAEVWNAGGSHYDEISRGIADSIEHCVMRLHPQPGERILDLSTGTGWTSRVVARRGARVVGVDIAGDLLAAADATAAREGLTIEYQLGDAEALPFEDDAFDAIVSTCGIMFASRPERAASELARVCRRGGRIGLTTWRPDSTVAGMFSVMKRHMPPLAGPAAASPFEWGRPERVIELLGHEFALAFEHGVSYYREPSAEAAWNTFSNAYGPTRSLAASLDPERRAALRGDFIAFHQVFPTALGITVPRDYLLTLGVRM